MINNIPRMRTIKGAIEELKKLDPGTEFTEHALRSAIYKKYIPFQLAGRKKLVDMDNVIDYLKNGDANNGRN